MTKPAEECIKESEVLGILLKAIALADTTGRQKLAIDNYLKFKDAILKTEITQAPIPPLFHDTAKIAYRDATNIAAQRLSDHVDQQVMTSITMEAAE